MKLLLIDDDPVFTTALQETLRQQNYVLDIVTDGEQGWIYGSTYAYDLIILDWSLPKLDGIQLCQRFRAAGYQVPILLLTARRGRRDRVQGLDAGADDYLSKPFDLDELEARIRALIRRSSPSSLPVLRWGNLRLNPSAREATYNDHLLLLTAKEYGLLELFMRNRHGVFSIEEIIESLWSSVEYPSEATVRSHLRRLRHKLKLAGLADDPIETVRGRGYCLKPLAQPAEPVASDVAIESDSLSQKQQRHLEALTRAWSKYQKKSQQQLKALAEIARAWSQQGLREDDREQALLMSHRLAGNLGLFGFAQGSEIARKLEQALEQTTNLSKAQSQTAAQHFQELLQHLQQELATDIDLSQRIAQTFQPPSTLLLIVEHNAKRANVLARAAQAQGMQTQIASTPALAREWLERGAMQSVPDAVILGISFAQAATQSEVHLEYLTLIAEFKLHVPSIPVLVIADRDQFTDRIQVARHGGSFYLTPPVVPDQVIGLCQQFLARSTRSKKLMLVDDDTDFLHFVAQALEPQGFEVSLLQDPRQFWDRVQTVMPDVLVLDVAMPYLSGIDLCKVIRSHPQWHKLPILFLSIYADSEIRNQALASGGNDFIGKPVAAQQLIDRITNCLDRVAN